MAIYQGTSLAGVEIAAQGDYAQLVDLLKATNELIQFELTHPAVSFDEPEKEQWQQLVFILVEQILSDISKVETHPPSTSEAHTVSALVFQTINHLLRERMPRIKSADIRSAWLGSMERLEDYSLKAGLLDEYSSFSRVVKLCEQLESVLQATEYLQQSPKRWNFTWDQRENLELKINHLTNEVRNYKLRSEREIKSIEGSRFCIDPQWPKSRDSIAILYAISQILKPTGISSIVVDALASIHLILDLNDAAPKAHQAVNEAESRIAALKKKNEELKQSLSEAKKLAETGNFEKASAHLSLLPSTYKAPEQKEIQLTINRFQQRITYLQALYEKVLQGDLQKLQWRDIQKSCVTERNQIRHTGESASDYERAATSILEPLEKLVRNHFRILLIRNIAIILGITALFSFLIYKISVPQIPEQIFTLSVINESRDTQWQLFTVDGKPLGASKGASERLELKKGNYWIRFDRHKKVALHRTQIGSSSLTTVSDSDAFRAPFVRLQLFDVTKNPILPPSEQSLLIEGIPVNADIEGCHLPKGMRRFTLRQAGEPDYDISLLIQNKTEELSLVSPWVPITLTAEAQDLFGSINNGVKRPIPLKIYLPAGLHFLVVSDSRGEIRSSRQLIVEKNKKNEFYVGVPEGRLKVKTEPEMPDLQLYVNGISYGSPPKELNLTTGPIRIQLFKQGRLRGEANDEIQSNELTEKTFRFQ